MASPLRDRFGVVAAAAALIASGIVAACGLDADGASDVPVDASLPGVDVVAEPPDTGLDGAAADGRVDAGADGDAVDGDAGGSEAGPDGCAPIETDCLDGLDNDCNGSVDCADPACQAGYACVPAAPAGWTGYALYDDDRTAACPPDYATAIDTYEGFVVAPASCTACACGGATGATCGTTALLQCAPTQQCTQGATTIALSGPCTNFGAPLDVGPTDYCRVTPPVATAGSCPPSGGALNRTTPSFGKLSRICTGGRTGGGCDAAHVCVASPTGTAHGACVAQPVASASLCPSDYAHAHTVSLDGGVTDTRACSACSCADATGATCSGTATLHGGAGCTDGTGPIDDDSGITVIPPAPADIPVNGLCHTGLVLAPSTYASLENRGSVASQGSCAPDGGKLSGSVTVTAQTQLCCQN